jgi:APA family basic amino acid/polyamine antiporter
MSAVLAGAGTSSLFVLGVIALGAMLLAVLFGQLTRRIPNSHGGPRCMTCPIERDPA